MGKSVKAAEACAVSAMAAEVRRVAEGIRSSGAAELAAAVAELEAAEREMLAKVAAAADAVGRCLEGVRAGVAEAARKLAGAAAPAPVAKTEATKPKKRQRKATVASGGGAVAGAVGGAVETPTTIAAEADEDVVAHDDDGVPPVPPAGPTQRSFAAGSGCPAPNYFGEPFTVRADALAAALEAGDLADDRELSIRFYVSEREVRKIRDGVLKRRGAA